MVNSARNHISLCSSGYLIFIKCVQMNLLYSILWISFEIDLVFLFWLSFTHVDWGETNSIYVNMFREDSFLSNVMFSPSLHCWSWSLHIRSEHLYICSHGFFFLLFGWYVLCVTISIYMTHPILELTGSYSSNYQQPFVALCHHGARMNLQKFKKNSSSNHASILVPQRYHDISHIVLP